MQRIIHGYQQSARTKYLQQTTNYIPIGIKALIARKKLMIKVKKFYPEEVEKYYENLDEDEENEIDTRYS